MVVELSTRYVPARAMSRAQYVLIVSVLTTSFAARQPPPHRSASTRKWTEPRAWKTGSVLVSHHFSKEFARFLAQPAGAGGIDPLTDA